MDLLKRKEHRGTNYQRSLITNAYVPQYQDILHQWAGWYNSNGPDLFWESTSFESTAGYCQSWLRFPVVFLGKLQASACKQATTVSFQSLFYTLFMFIFTFHPMLHNLCSLNSVIK
jgi:hypothetical protein